MKDIWEVSFGQNSELNFMFIASDRLKDKALLQHDVYSSSNTLVLGVKLNHNITLKALCHPELERLLELFGLTMDMVNFVDMPI